MSRKASRRSMIKAMAAAGAALAAAPYLAKVSFASQQSSNGKMVLAGSTAQGSGQQSSSSTPLVFVVKGDHVLGYRGLQEVPIRDASLAAMLNNAFVSAGGKN
jgi:hypothetical protein